MTPRISYGIATSMISLPYLSSIWVQIELLSGWDLNFPDLLKSRCCHMVIKIWNWKSRSHIQCQYGPRRKVNMDKKVTCSQSIKLEAITFILLQSIVK